MSGLLNSIAGPDGGVVLLYIVFAIGILLALKSLWVVIFNFIQKHRLDQQAEKERLENIRQLERAHQTQAEPSQYPKSRPTRVSSTVDPGDHSSLHAPDRRQGTDFGLRKLASAKTRLRSNLQAGRHPLRYQPVEEPKPSPTLTRLDTTVPAT
jgi:hypothetical protein